MSTGSTDDSASATTERVTPPAERRPVFALLAANAVSQTGNMMTAVAVPWFVLTTTGSAILTGITSAAMALGAVVPAILGGPLVDRMGFKRASVLGDLLSGAVIASVPVLHLAGVLEPWHLPILVFLFTSINAQGDTARYALIPPLATRASMAMERANAADRAIARIGQLVGPIAAGILITQVGAANVLFVDAFTFTVSAAIVAVGIPSDASRRLGPVEVGLRRNYRSDLVEGLRFVRGNALIFSMVVVALVGNFLDVPLVSVIIPIYAREFFDSPASLGLVIGAFGGGALLGTILFGALGLHLPRRITFIGCWVIAPLLIYGTLAATPPVAVVVAAAAFGGIVAGSINPILLTVIQENTPPQLLGRVFGALNAIAQAGIPVGAALAGFVVEGIGIVETIVAMLVIYLAVTLGMLLNPAFHRMDRTPIPT